MDKHPSYPVVGPYFRKYPLAASGLFQAYNDIVYGQQWLDVDLLDLGEEHGRAAIRGRRKKGIDEGGGAHDTFSYVVPCSLAETLTFDWLRTAFEKVDATEIYLAITSEDASIVYYKISNGIVKPPI